MLVRRCAQLEATTPTDVTSAAIYTLRLLARRILQLTTEIHDLLRHITDTITRHCPTLLTRRGVGPDNAAALLITAGDNPNRLHSEASFAALCGVNPLDASSGKTSRRRLNRGISPLRGDCRGVRAEVRGTPRARGSWIHAGTAGRALPRLAVSAPTGGRSYRENVTG